MNPFSGNPVNCDFDSDFCGWKNAENDEFDWTRHKGEAPSDWTGPKSDHTTGSGQLTKFRC